MADLAGSLGDEHAAAHLERTIQGSGAFRRFKDMVDALGMHEQWFEYRDGRYREVAREWCEGEGIEREDDRPPSASE